MREYKFRGRRIDTGEWVYGNILQTGYGTYIIPYQEYTDRLPQIKVDPETVGQYTGLKDRNGQEIYKGDVVSTHNQNNIVEYDRGSFVVSGLHEDKYERTYALLSYYLIDVTIPDIDGSKYDGVTTSLEVIGNIYENPELLKEESTP